jgi:hypothetical protein
VDCHRHRHLRPLLDQLGHLGGEWRLRPPRRDDRLRREHARLRGGHGHRGQHCSGGPCDLALRIERVGLRLRVDDLRKHRALRFLRRLGDELRRPVGDREDPLPRPRGRRVEPLRRHLRLRRSHRLAERDGLQRCGPDRLRHVHGHGRHDGPERVLAHGSGRRRLHRKRHDSLGEPHRRRLGDRPGRVPLLRRIELFVRLRDDDRRFGTASPPTAPTRSSPGQPTMSATRRTRRSARSRSTIPARTARSP